MVMISVWLIVGFIVGALTVIAVEGVVILYVIRRLSHSTKSSKLGVHTSPPNPLDSSLSLPSGVVWVLEPERHPKFPVQTEQTRKREIIEVSPVRKLAKVKDHMLILAEADGSLTKVMLRGCKVVAVSATSLPTRKWYAMEEQNRMKNKRTDEKTSCEKESWCKALRIASLDDKEKLLWFPKISEDFRGYLKSLSVGYPFLIKPLVGYQGWPLDKANRLDDPPSKVRQIWRKLSRKTSLVTLDEKRVADKSHGFQDLYSAPSITRAANLGKMRNEFEEDSPSVSSTASTHSGNSTHGSDNSDADTAEKFIVDEGTLCWNLLVSRLFFDAKSNVDIKAGLKARIQRSLSNMRLPNYIGEVTCTDVDPGNLPPYIHGMRAIPSDMNDVWAMEMDIEYSGGVVLYIEARLEVPELDSHSGLADHNTESSSVGQATTDLLDDLKPLQEEEDLKLYDGNNDSSEQKDAEDRKHELLRSSRTGVSTASSGSRWKSILNSVAKHVSQVPLTLAIRVVTLKGTIQLHMKPPPSDQLWFGFTCMPDIQFQLESSVKDHKVTNGRVASFLINRFKASIRDTLVLPNCESVCIPWMLAEKDDWIPCNAAPLMWLNREAQSEINSSEGSRNKRMEDRDLESKLGKQKKNDPLKRSIDAENGQVVPSAAFRRSSSDNNVPSQDLKEPLLQNEESRDMVIHRKQENSECPSPSRYVSLREERNSLEDDDTKSKRPVGKKARMFDLGKKMGEKFEEKRRHIEEKSRHIVEKMRGPGS
uniref:SMP-LTD domain-containing protein n=1 Tax=Chenopodium quinoa TaxID=63459 RepID=A0A803N771_CHEQI